MSVAREINSRGKLSSWLSPYVSNILHFLYAKVIQYIGEMMS